jgi:hypothetical protein
LAKTARNVLDAGADFAPGNIPGGSKNFAGPAIALYIPAPGMNSSFVMDKFWSIFSMPIGVTLCFGPAVLVWWLTRGKDTKPDEKQDRH